MSQNSNGRLLILVGVLAVIVGGYFFLRNHVPSKPSKEQIVADCKRLVQETTVWAGRGHIPIQKVERPFKAKWDATILGVSVAGNEAVVKAQVPLEGRVTFQILPQGGGDGFGKYLTKAMQIEEWRTVEIEVTLTYRKYDNGWRLESY